MIITSSLYTNEKISTSMGDKQRYHLAIGQGWLYDIA